MLRPSEFTFVSQAALTMSKFWPQVVNKQESDAIEQLGCPFVAVNVSVGLSLSMPSIATKIAGAAVPNTATHMVAHGAALRNIKLVNASSRSSPPACHVCRGLGSGSAVWKYDARGSEVRLLTPVMIGAAESVTSMLFATRADRNGFHAQEYCGGDHHAGSWRRVPLPQG